MNKLFEYKKKLPHHPHWRGVQETNILDANKTFVLEFISIDDFKNLFGGYLKCFDNPRTSELPNYVGVWGKNNVAKLKRILRERGAEFEICKIDGNSRTISIISQDYVGSVGSE